MKEKYFFFAAAMLIYAGLSHGASNKPADNAKNWDSTITVHHNRWETYTSNYGPVVLPKNSPGGFWRKPTHNYIYGAGLWIGAVKNSNTLVSVGYNPTTTNSEFTPSAITGDTIDDVTAKLYLSSESDWPLHKFAGGDSIVSSLDTYTKFDDWDSLHHSDGAPLNIKVSQTSYAWNWYVSSLKDVVFFVYEVQNASGDTLRDIYLGACFDNDVGYETGGYANDLVTFKHDRNLGIQYQSIPEDGWDTTGVVGVRFFESPACTKASVSVVDNEYPHTITQGEQLGMTAFKIFNLYQDPQTDGECYLEMQGIHFWNMIADAYDEWGGITPGDKRFIMCSGPFDMKPDTMVRLVVGIIGANDTLSAMAVSDYAQAIYDNSFVTLPIIVTDPSTAQVVNGNTDISWSCAVSCSTDIYYSSDEGENWFLLVSNQPGTGSYSWNTTTVSDGVKYKIGIFAHNSNSFGWDESDEVFTIDNTAIIAPQFDIMDYPQTWSGTRYLNFMHGDADNDQLTKTLYIQKLDWDTTRWDQVAASQGYSQLWSLDSLAWNTTTYPNYYYNMLLTINDGTDAVAETMNYYNANGHGYVLLENDFPSTDSAVQTSGTAKFTSPTPYVIFPAQLTGHNYEYRFKPLSGYYSSSALQYFYTLSYDFWDADANTQLLSDCHFTVRILNYAAQQFYSPDPADGIVPEVRWQQGVFGQGQNCDSIKITTDAGNFSLDTLKIFAADTNLSLTPKWMFRGCDFEIRWHVLGAYPNDTLTAEVWDMDNNVLVPVDTLAWNNLSQSAWSFGTTATGAGRSIITNAITTLARKYIFICGARVMFNQGASIRNMTWDTHPAEGEIWRLYTHGPKPPREGDIYRFKGVSGVTGNPGKNTFNYFLAQNAPNPFGHSGTSISYQVGGSGSVPVSLKIYNIAGQLVKTLVNDHKTPGRYNAAWDGRSDKDQKVSAGIYIYRLQAGEKNITKKMVLIK